MNGNANRRVEHRHEVARPVGPCIVGTQRANGRVLANDWMAAAPECASRCVMTTSDRAGRLADRSVIRCLGWDRHTSVRFDWRRDVILVVPAGGGQSSITTQGHLRLPLAIRRRSRIDAGSRLLVLAWAQTGRLVICAPSAVEEMLLDRMHGVSGRCVGAS